MAYSIEPAYLVQNELTRLIIKAGTDPVNKWFFTDGAFTPDSQLERTPNTWMHENFVVIENKQVLAYFEAFWNKPLNIITSFIFCGSIHVQVQNLFTWQKRPVMTGKA